MIDVNLIPQTRLVARRQQRRTMRWTVSLGIYAIALFTSLSVLRLLSAFDGRELSAQIASLNTKLNQAESQDKSIRNDIKRAKATFDKHHAIGEQPDWSMLLTLIGSKLGDETALRSIRLRPAAEAVPAPTSTPQQVSAVAAPVKKESKIKSGQIMLELSGVSQSQMAVSQFVLRLEQLGVFDQVRLVETRREPFLSSEVIAFRVSGELSGGMEDAP